MSFGVAMVSSVFYPSIGGAQTHTLRLSQKLQARGVRVLVVTRHYNGLAEYEEIGGVPTYRVGKGDANKAAAAITFIGEAIQTLYAQRHQYHIVHCHQMISPMTIGLLARPVVRKPLVINPHARGPIGDVAVLSNRRPVTGKIRLSAARRWGDAFVSISTDIREELRSINVDEDKLWDIPNGVDVEHFTPADPPMRAALRQSLKLPDGPLVIYTGRLAPEKGLDVLLNAWPQVVQNMPDAHVLLLGEGELRTALEQQAERLGIADRVIFGGGCADVAPYLRAADVFVLPSRTEGLPVALLEAMACSVPIVASAVGGMLQVLEDGRTGYLVPVEDAPALATSILKAVSSPDATQMGVQARQHVTQHYSLDVVAERYIAMYETLLQPQGSQKLIVR